MEDQAVVGLFILKQVALEFLDKVLLAEQAHHLLIILAEAEVVLALLE
jgi:hypothetical protein